MLSLGALHTCGSSKNNRNIITFSIPVWLLIITLSRLKLKVIFLLSCLLFHNSACPVLMYICQPCDIEFNYFLIFMHFINFMHVCQHETYPPLEKKYGGFCFNSMPHGDPHISTITSLVDLLTVALNNPNEMPSSLIW